MSIYGYLNLGTGLSGLGIVTPSAVAGYARQPVSFGDVLGGVTVNQTACVFGPVTGTWGALNIFDITDADGNPMFTGTLRPPFVPAVGQIVFVEPGDISIVLYPQFVNDGGVLTTDIGIFPDSDAGLAPGDVWSNNGVLNYVPGFIPATTPTVFIFGQTTAMQLLAAGVSGIPTVPAYVGQFYLVGQEIWVADSSAVVTLTNNGGVLTTSQPFAPSTDAGLPPGAIWSNSGVPNVVSGYSPSSAQTILIFGEATIGDIMAAGGAALTFSYPPPAGSEILYVVGQEIWIA